MIKFREEIVTPEMAHQLLAVTPHARQIVASRVKTYAADMARGWWRLTAEPVKIAEDGLLLNGHHRMHAVVMAGVKVRMHFAYGVSADTKIVQDTGLGVRARDWSDRKNVGHGLAIMNAILRATGYIHHTASKLCLFAMWDEFGDEHLQFASATKSRSVNASARMALALVHRVDVARAELMLSRLSMEESAPTKSPEHTWLRLMSSRYWSAKSQEANKLALSMARLCARGECVSILRVADPEPAIQLFGLGPVLALCGKPASCPKT